MHKIPIPTNDGSRFIDLSEISHYSIENDKYCWLVMITGKKLLLQATIDQIFEDLTKPPFLRIHEDHIVNLEQVEKVNMQDGRIRVKMKNGMDLPASPQNIQSIISHPE